MYKFNLDECPGKSKGEGEYNRIIKLLASPNSKIVAPDFALGIVLIEPGHLHEIHNHLDNREVVVIYEGSGTIHQKDGDEGIFVKKGDVIGFEKNEPHGFSNSGDEQFSVLWIYYPAGVAENNFLIK